MNCRRYFIRDSGALLGSVFLSSCATLPLNKKDPSLGTGKNIGSVTIVGGGFSGASLARYLSILSRERITITLINKSKFFYSCPIIFLFCLFMGLFIGFYQLYKIVKRNSK